MYLLRFLHHPIVTAMDHWSLHDRSLLDEREFLSGMKSTLELVSKLLKPRSFKENSKSRHVLNFIKKN